MRYELATISEMIELHLWDSELESEMASVEIIVTFDHDTGGAHFLVQQWDRFADKAEWIYALYLRTWSDEADGDVVTLVKEWPSGLHADGLVPIAEAAVIVQDWRRNLKRYKTFLEWKNDQRE